METKEKAPMMKGKSVSVQKRLRNGFMLILAMMIVSIAISVAALMKVGSDYKNAIINYGFSQGYAGQLGTSFNAMTTQLRDLILETKDEEIVKIKTALDEQVNLTTQYLEQVTAAANTQEEYDLLEELEDALTTYRSIRADVIELAEANQNDEAYLLLDEQGVALAAVVKNNINKILEINIDKCESTMNSANILTVILTVCICVFALIAVLAGIKISSGLSKSICDPLIELTNAADKIKKGELDIEIRNESEDELGVLSEAFRETCGFLSMVIQDLNYIMTELSDGNFNVRSKHLDAYIGEFSKVLNSMKKMVVQVSDVMQQINYTSEQVALGSGQMASSAQGLAEGATDQAGSIEELQATIADITSQVSENARQAVEASEKAAMVAKEADTSNREMQAMTEAMERISETSQRINNIIAGIEDIATQTNLLSLNAAIEAARAGEAGKGFAVVAEQVKVLAEQSAQSAKDTRELIESSILEVENGSTISEKTASSLSRVVEAINNIKVNIDAVSASSQGQAEAMHQLEQGVEQISGVVQNNSAAAEETSATSEELSAQAENLSQLVKKFNVRVEN